MNARIMVTGFAAPDEAALGAFEDPEIPPRSRRELYPDFIFRFHPEITPAHAGAKAAQSSIALAGVEVASIDLVVSCTHTPDMESPGLGSLITRQLGLVGVPAIELRALSAGPILAIEHASNLIRCGKAKRVLVVCVDFLTRFFPREWLKGPAAIARGVCSDGAAAFLVMAEHDAPPVEEGILALDLVNSSQGAVGLAPEVFSTEVPSSSQSPTRISLEDIDRKRHIPVLHVHRLFAHALHFLPPVIDRLLLDIREIPGILQFHELLAGLGGGVLTACESPFIGFHDIFTSRGFSGSAGLPLGLAVLPVEALEETGRPLTVVGLGSGPLWGVAVFRRWQ